MITVTLLGTAATMPLPDRALTAAVLECSGHSLLFDCGEGTQAAARRAGVSLMKLDGICLTHWHGDHIFGLPGLLQTLGCQGREKPLALFAPAGDAGLLEALRVLTGPLPYPLRPALLPPEGLDLTALGWPAGAALSAFPTRHRVASQGYCFTLARAGKFDPQRARALGVAMPLWGRLQKGETVSAGERLVRPEEVLGPARRGLRVVFSGDTAPCPGLEEAARGADLLLCDATYPTDDYADQAALYGHSTFPQCGALAARAGARRLWLVHYSPIIQQPEAYLGEARAAFPAAECGADGKQITLRFEEEP